MIRQLMICTALIGAAIGTASSAEGDSVSRLRHARSLRCTYTASALTAFRPELSPERRITTEHDEMVVIYDNINIERGTARVIYEKGVPGGGAGDLAVRWRGDSLWFIETAPAGNLILTTIFGRYATGTAEFIALDSRHFGFAIVTGSMASGTCKPLT